jgi:hypothetical protein
MLSPEPGTVDPDAMQNDRELAGDSGLGLDDADASRTPQAFTASMGFSRARFVIAH